MSYFVPTPLTQDELKSKYRALSKKLHPDLNNGNDYEFKLMVAEYNRIKPSIGIAHKQTYDNVRYHNMAVVTTNDIASDVNIYDINKLFDAWVKSANYIIRSYGGIPESSDIKCSPKSFFANTVEFKVKYKATDDVLYKLNRYFENAGVMNLVDHRLRNNVRLYEKIGIISKIRIIFNKIFNK